MARLMERLQKVDNDSPTDSATTSQLDQASLTAATLPEKDSKKSEQGSCSEPKGLVRKTSGSLKLERRPMSNKAKPSLIRHSSLGILPSSIAIGGGFVYDDHYIDAAKRRKEASAKPSRQGQT